MGAGISDCKEGATRQRCDTCTSTTCKQINASYGFTRSNPFCWPTLGLLFEHPLDTHQNCHPVMAALIRIHRNKYVCKKNGIIDFPL